MQKTSLVCSKFSGLNRTASVFSSSVVTASDIQNVELYSTGINSGVGIRVSAGNRSVCNSIPEGETVVNIFESIQSSVTYFFVHTESATEGKIYLLNPETGALTLKVSGLSLTGKSCAVDVSQGWSDLWVFSNSEEMLTIEIGKTDANNEPDEITMMSLSDMEGRTVKGMGLAIFAGRLWVFDKNILWYSVQEDIYDFETSDAEIVTSSGYIEFVKNITAIYPYLGTLAVFHRDSSCLIVKDDESGSFSKSFDSPGGCAGNEACVFHGTELYFYDDVKKGVFSFRQVVNGDKTLGENIALDIQEELLTIKSSAADKVKILSVVTSDRNEVWFLIPDDNSGFSTIMIYDYIRRTWVKRKSQKINSFRVIGGKLYSAGEKVYAEYETILFDGEFIEAFYKCAPLNLGVENSLKILAYPPKITMDMYCGNDFYVEYTKDYNSMTFKKRRVKSKTLKEVLYFDKGNWDVNIYPYDKIYAIKRLPSSYFKTLQISFCTGISGQSFCISNIEFGKIKVKI